MVFGVSSQQPTDTQETAEDRQPVPVTSEGEVRGALRGPHDSGVRSC